MKCMDCDCCRKGFFESKPEVYVCIGVKEPFVIDNIEKECTEYPEKNKCTAISTIKIAPVELAKAYVGNDGIYVPIDANSSSYKLLVSKELFIEAYNKWIKGEENEQPN